MSNENELRKLIDRTIPGQTVLYPASKVGGREEVRFFAVSSSFSYRRELFNWPGRPKPESIPSAATFWTSQEPLDGNIDYTITFDGPVKKTQDYYTYGTIFFVSDELKNIIVSFDPDGLDIVECKLICADGERKFWAGIPARTIIAVDVLGSDVTIHHKIGVVRNIPFVYLPLHYHFTSEIEPYVHIFQDAVSPNIYWSRDMLSKCKSMGVKGILAQAPYCPNTPSIEM